MKKVKTSKPAGSGIVGKVGHALKALGEIGNVPSAGKEPAKGRASRAGRVAKQAASPQKILASAAEFLKRMLRRKTQDVKRDEDVVKEVKRIVEKAEKSAKRSTAEEGLAAVANAFRASMRHLLGLRYEFTFEELERELDKKRLRSELKQSLRVLSEKLDEMEYGGGEVDKKRVTEVSKEVKNVVWELIG